MTQTSIALWGASSLDNWGDQLIAVVAERALACRISSARFVHFCPWSQDQRIRRLQFDANGNWPHADAFHAVVVVGGGLLAGPPFRHHVMQLFCFGTRPEQFAPQLRVAWNAVGLEDATCPPEDAAHENYLRQLRSRLDYCSVRSLETAKRIGPGPLNSPTHIVPDCVYALPSLKTQRPSKTGKIRIGVCVGDPFPTKQFVSRLAGKLVADSCPIDATISLTQNKLLKTAMPFSEKQRQVTFLPTVVDVLKKVTAEVELEFFGFGSMYGDKELAARIARLIPDSAYRHIAANTNYRLLQRLIQSYDALIVSRYHAAILAHRADRPFIAVDPYWNYRTCTSKLKELMASINQQTFYWNGGSDPRQSESALATAIGEMLDNLQRLDRVPYERFHQKATANFDCLASFIVAEDGFDRCSVAV